MNAIASSARTINLDPVFWTLVTSTYEKKAIPPNILMDVLLWCPSLNNRVLDIFNCLTSGFVELLELKSKLKFVRLQFAIDMSMKWALWCAFNTVIEDKVTEIFNEG